MKTWLCFISCFSCKSRERVKSSLLVYLVNYPPSSRNFSCASFSTKTTEMVMARKAGKSTTTSSIKPRRFLIIIWVTILGSLITSL